MKNHQLRIPRVLWFTAAIIVVLLAFGLRFYQLGTQSLWNDEGASVVMAGRSWQDILTNAAADIHPPGYYMLLSKWSALAGRSEFALRALSALESVLSVVLVYTLGRRLLGRDAGFLAALLLAVNTFAIYYAQETRMYAQLGLLATASMWMLVVWLDKANPRVLVVLVMVNAAGLYTQYAYPLTMIAQGIVFLLWLARHRDWRSLGWYVSANTFTLILFAPWAGEAIRQVTTWPNSGSGTPPQVLIDTLAFGITTRGGVSWLALFSALIFAASGLWLNRARPLLLLPVIWLAVTAGAFLLLGLQVDDTKQLTPALSAASLWLGMGAAALWRDDCITPRLLAIGATGVMAVTLAGGLSEFYSNPDYLRDDYRGMVAQVEEAPRPDDAVILNGPGQGEVWSYYYTGAAPVYPLPRALGGDDAATQAETAAILRDHRRIFALFWGEAERDPNHVVESMLDSHAFEVSSAWYGSVRFVVYAAPGDSPDEPSEALDIRFGMGDSEPISLQGIALNRAAFQPGDALTITLFWSTDEPLEQRYKVFVHLYADPTAPPPAQHDSEPGGGQSPTTGWQPGSTVIDRHGILLPPDLPPGAYTLAVGLYDAADPASRLTTSQGERVEIASIEVN